VSASTSKPLNTRKDSEMTLPAPVTELNPNFSSPGANAVPWPDAEQQLRNAEVFWIATVRPEGRPHVVPLIAVWLEGALCFTTGEEERKAKNLANNARVSIATGCDALSEGLDIIVEGLAVVVGDDTKLRRVQDAYANKYGEGWRLPTGDGIIVFEVVPTTAFGFGRSAERSSWGPPPAGGSARLAGASRRDRGHGCAHDEPAAPPSRSWSSSTVGQRA
jgi:general stress protein 26